MTDQRARPTVELRLPADGAYAAVLRTTAAAIAARLDFTVDDIEDLRIATGEASALVIPSAAPGAGLLARFHLGPGTMTVELSTDVDEEPTPDYDSFAWQVLDTLAEGATVEASGTTFLVRFTLTAQTARPDPFEPPAPGAGSRT